MKRFKAFETHAELSEFPGLIQAASHFNHPFEIIDYRRDPHVDGVYLLFIKFTSPKKSEPNIDSTFSPKRTGDREERSKSLVIPNLGCVGKHGLCIYNTISQEFVEEPATLESYETDLEKVRRKYGFRPDEETNETFEPKGKREWPNKLYPEVKHVFGGKGGLFDVSNEEMEKNIGRYIKFKREPGDSLGLIHNFVHKIVAIQKNYKDDLCYRVVCVEGPYAGSPAANFGSVADPKQIEFLPKDYVVKNESFVNEAKIFPMTEYSRSHMATWLDGYRPALAKMLMKSFGAQLKFIKSWRLEVSEELLQVCNEKGIEVLNDAEGLEIWIRHINADGKVWIQIGATGNGSNRNSGSQYEVCFGSKSDHNPNEFTVVKNVEDLKKIQQAALEMYSDIDKKGYTKEIKEIAKQQNFKMVWNTEEINKLANAILKGIKIAADKRALKK